MEGQEKTQNIGHKARIRKSVDAIVSIFDPTIERVPLEQIDERTVAMRIKQQIVSHLRIADQINPRPFTVVGTLQKLNYSAEDRDYRKQYPRESHRVQLILDGFEDNGVLRKLTRKEPDIHGETVYYEVVDETKLNEIAQSAK